MKGTIEIDARMLAARSLIVPVSGDECFCRLETQITNSAVDGYDYRRFDTI
jgi:hypothetical protein